MQLLGGKYQLLEILGAGSSGTVYRAKDHELDVIRAVKILAPHLVGNDRVRKRFKAEAKTQAKLAHTHIVHALGLVEDGDQLAIVMNYVEGCGKHAGCNLELEARCQSLRTELTTDVNSSRLV